MCVCVCTRLTSPWREWSGRRRLEGGSSTLRGPGTGACERLEETHRHTHKRTLGEVSGLGSNELFALLVLWEPGIKRRDTLDTSRTLLFPPCRRNVCVCVCDAAVCVGPSTGSWCRQLVSLVYSTRVTSCGKKRSPHFENTHRHTPKHAHKQTISTYFISTFSRNVFQQKKHRQLDSVPSHSKYPVSLCLPLCALQRKSFVNRQHLALSAARLLTCVCSRGMLSMTVIWPRLRACFRTPSHYKSGRQECDWVSRPVSPLRSFLPSLSLSHHALPPSSSSSPPSSFSCSPPPFHWADLLSRSFSPLFYLLPLCSPLSQASLLHYNSFPSLTHPSQNYWITLRSLPDSLSPPPLPRLVFCFTSMTNTRKQAGRVAPTTKPFSHLSHIHHFNPPVKLISYFPLLLFWFPLSFLCNNACMWYMIKSYA